MVHYLSTGYNDKIANGTKSDTTVCAIHPIEILHRQHQHCPSKTAEECEIIIRSRYSKGKDDSSRHSVYERSLDDDSTSGSIVEPVYYYNNSVQMELENLDLAIQPELRLVQLQAQKIPDYSYSGSDDLSLEQMSVIPSHSCGQRGNGKESQRRCFLKHDYRRGSRDIQHLSYITHKESDDEDSSSHTNYRNAVRSLSLLTSDSIHHFLYSSVLGLRKNLFRHLRRVAFNNILISVYCVAQKLLKYICRRSHVNLEH